MKILVTNDDGIRAKGIQLLARLLKPYGQVTVVAPSHAQSGMSLAIPLKRDEKIFSSEIIEEDGIFWQHIDTTPGACVKFALGRMFKEEKPDIIVSGINHGANTATAVCYSATLGAAAEGAINRIPAIGVSMDTGHPDADFSAVEHYFPRIFEALVERYKVVNPRDGIYYNINFPYLPTEKIKGIAAASMGRVHWCDEFVANPDGTWHLEGVRADDNDNVPDADHKLVDQGYISIVPHRIDSTDYQELSALKTIFPL
ncbi:MAG: 5'/3'-nucleotidase SurE [Bacteroidales bacterium]|nr:5'/3'-nucleotidase SurE [Bacteroidales bacterium]